MSWIKEEPLDENEYKLNPDLYQDLSQDIDKIHRNDIIDNMKKEHNDDNGHRNDHLDIIDSIKKEHSDDFRSHSEVHFEKKLYIDNFFLCCEKYCV